jgi:signal transduction histidine kinase/ligand-binding sensor domain-containing protein/DNA-binding response OmpR family regulator
MYIKEYIISLIFLLWMLNVSDGQQVYYLNVKDGLSSRYTHGVEQDYKGLIWFATREGVDRYDGTEFRNYKLHSTVINPTELGYRFNILCDTSAVIWAYTTSGKIFRYNQFRDEFELLLDLQKEIEGYKNVLYVNTLFFDRSNTLWIGTTVGTYYAKISGSILQHVEHYNDLNTYSFVESDSGMIWEGTQFGVRLLSLDEYKNYEPEVESTIINASKDINISTLFYDAQNKKLWIGSSNNGPSVYDFNEKQWIDLSKSTPHVPIRSIVKDSHNNILIGLDGAGIRMLDASNYKILNAWLKTEDLSGGISDNSIQDIHCDLEGRIWISTWFAGITIIDFQKPKLEFIKHQFNINSILSSNVNSIFEDSDGDLWFGTNYGVSVLKKSTNKWGNLLNLEDSKALSGYKILTIAEDDRRRIWIGGYANGLHCYDKNSKKLTDFTSKAGTIYLYNAHYDDYGNMWFGGMEGLLTKMDLKSGRFSNYNIRNVTVIINKNKGQLWVGTASGLFIVDNNFEKVISYREFAGDLAEISNKYINCLYQDNAGRLWIGTNGGGLNLYDSEKNQLSLFSTEDGLPSNFINSIFSDKNGTIWLGTDMGIGCFNPNTGRSINIGFIENFTNFPSYRNAFARKKSGDFILGGIYGAVVFTPEIIKPYTSKAKLFFNEFRLSYQRVLPGDPGSPLKLPIDLESAIVLNFNQNSFSFNFSSINFDKTGQLAYKWRLDGFDSEWTPFTNNKTAGYTNIPPGNFTFKIRCYSQNNLVFDDERQIAISIKPPFWGTDLAYAVYLVLFFSLSWLVYFLLHNRLQKKHASDKINFFINTAHSIKTPVSLIKAPLRDLELDKGITDEGLYYLRIAQSNADRLSQIVNQVLDFDKVDTNKLQMEISSNNLASYFKEKIISFQLLAEDQGIVFKHNIPDYDVYAMFDVDKMDMIIDNLISNAIKYTNCKGCVELIVGVNEKEWTLKLSDTGIGIPKKDRKNLFKMYYRADNAVNSRKPGSGLGLMLIQNLVRLHRGKISYTSTVDIGSTFILSFPRKSVSKKISLRPAFSMNKMDTAIQIRSLDNKTSPFHVPETPSSQLKVLIVEDDNELRNYLVHTLGKQFQVCSTDDGQIAAGMVQKENFDLVISDVMLPNLRGDELCRIIKSNIESSHIPVILLTALSDKKNTIIGLEAGADSYIPKPFDIDIVNSQISNILKNRHLISESLLKGVNPNSDKVAINNLDKALIKEILNIVERELSNPEFSITNLCRETAMSRTLLYTKIKVHTGLAPNEFIRIIRMNKSMDLLKAGQNTISEVANIVGFHDSKYFSTSFKKFFGKSPSNYHLSK